MGRVRARAMRSCVLSSVCVRVRACVHACVRSWLRSSTCVRVHVHSLSLLRFLMGRAHALPNAPLFTPPSLSRAQLVFTVSSWAGLILVIIGAELFSGQVSLPLALSLRESDHTK